MNRTVHRQDRAAARSLFLRHQDRVDARPCARARASAAERGELCFGTIDCFLIWRLTGGKVHVTDATNASRTLLYNIHTGAWDDELLGILRRAARHAAGGQGLRGRFRRTRCRSCSARPFPSLGVAGDQQAATHRPGLLRARHDEIDLRHRLLRAAQHRRPARLPRSNRLLTTIAYQLDGKRTYALEGAIFIAGAAVQWLRDGLKVMKKAADTGALAKAADQKPERLSGAGICRPRRALLGRRGARRDFRPDPRHHEQGTGAGRAGSGVLPDPRSSRGDETGLGSHGAKPSCGSTAA